MEEYYGSSVKNYKQPQDKFYTLFPALDRLLADAKGKQSLLDLACGTGDLYSFVGNKGYSYTGIDISEDMLAQAKRRHPDGTFLLGDATELKRSDMFDVVLCNMLLPSVATKAAFNAVFQTGADLLLDDGTLIVSSGHPCFDGYMGKKFFGRTDIETEFKGYFQSGSKYKVMRKLGDSDFVFTDYHWTFTDYMKAAHRANLQLTALDECPLSADTPVEIANKIHAKGTPSYIVFQFKKKH